MRKFACFVLAACWLLALPFAAQAQMAGAATADPLWVVRDGKALVSVVVAADAGETEKLGAADLLKYVEMMTGVRLPQVAVAPGARAPGGPALVVGKAALAEERSLASALARVAKKNPVLAADAIVMRRKGERVYLAGSNDRAHAFAVSKLLQDWGCRWYMPTEFGEVVPEHAALSVGALDYAYGSPFEIRSYWLSWLGDNTGREDFQRRNFANASTLPIFGHALGAYTKSLIPQGKSAFNVPLAEPATAEEVARQVDAQYAKGVPGISLAIEDGIYTSDSAADHALQSNIVDKYMLAPANTDAMVTLYNNVARILRARHPDSPTKVGGLAYSNVTLPPQAVTQIEPNIVMWLAPIDIDPNHGMDDPRSPPRQEYKGMMYRWADLLKGRLAIYDYDQGMLVWRDLPNPSQHAFAQDVQHYHKAGILGVNTESRGATATTFLNLFFRLQLLWNPDADVDALLADFYPRFYGPAAGPMAEYWNAIFAAWKDTIVTEHEYFVIPAIYTPELVERLGRSLATAKAALAASAAAPPTSVVPAKSGTQGSPASSRNQRLYAERLHFTELSFALLQNYVRMVQAGATEGDFAKAAAEGEQALAIRAQLTALNPTFTTLKMGENGAAWLPGEVAQMGELLSLTDGTRGKLLAKTPLVWSFLRDPLDTGLARGWAYTPAAQVPGAESLRTDLYLQAQGVRHADGQSFTGYYWYQTELDLERSATSGPVHLMFPGLFNTTWLYVNGVLVAHRPYREPWWATDYRFTWDVDLTGKLRPGKNLVTLRGMDVHHFGGMFRRPFLYRPIQH